MSDSNLRTSRPVRTFAEIGIADVPLVGGKNASLGELYQELTKTGVNVPNGFAITAPAFRATIEAAGITDQLHAILDEVDGTDVALLQERAAKARALVYEAELPEDIAAEIIAAYADLQEEYGEDLTLAVRSSATAEDLPEASFAGAHETFLNVAGDADLLDAVRRCFASLFTDRGIHYRIEHGFGQFDVAQSVTVQKMVRADLACSGVLFTLDTESGFEDVVFITGAYGLGENVVQGAVDPDEFHVFKPTLRDGFETVLRRRLGGKSLQMVYAGDDDGATTVNIDVDDERRAQFCLTDAEVIELAKAGDAVEAHYSAQAGTHRPMDIEWAKDGIDGRLYLVQARPETVASQTSHTTLDIHHLDGTAETLVEGRAVGARIASGSVRVVKSVAELPSVQPGDVLVADITDPDWEPVLKTASAVVTNRGGRTCHAAIVARELGIPAVVGTGDATDVLTNGTEVTVSCADGDVGHVLAGLVPHHVEHIEIGHLERPRTKIQVNLGNPDLAFATAAIPNDGVGLARMEFIINEYIKAHPMALLHPEQVESAEDRAALGALTAGYQTPAEFFIERLSEGVATIAAAFYPKQVVVRLSDFKSNEYASLLGGRGFEPIESNPMLGFRGAARYSHPAYREGFALECAAIKRVRDDMGLVNVVPMVPFCRRVAEARTVIDEMAANGLVRGENGLEIYVMCEIPNNVISLDAFAEYFDGFSIGSNDLTQLALGVDRDSEIVAFDYDEGEPGVLELFRLAITGCQRTNRHSGFCGQAPSDRPEMAAFLVEHGIDAISLNPDVVIATTISILELEAAADQS
ncbi:MAG: phosphoenolpyruvate synthase [Acidimicrobiales bacterium]|nr:phosphoenolpyruvate synthase [Acidimicrobiales bacterium]